MTTQHPVDSHLCPSCHAIGGHLPDCARKCPDWCTQHEELDSVDADGSHPQQHLQWLFFRYAPVQPAMPSLAVYVSDVESTLSPWGPGMSIQMYDDPPQALDAEEARRLAAALIRGAEILDAALTAVCPSCGGKVAPAELEYVDEDDGVASGDCLSCVGRRKVAERNARRQSLKVVEKVGR